MLKNKGNSGLHNARLSIETQYGRRHTSTISTNVSCSDRKYNRGTRKLFRMRVGPWEPVWLLIGHSVQVAVVWQHSLDWNAIPEHHLHADIAVSIRRLDKETLHRCEVAITQAFCLIMQSKACLPNSAAAWRYPLLL